VATGTFNCEQSGRHYTAFKNIYHVRSTFIASITVDVFETDRRCKEVQLALSSLVPTDSQ